MRRTQTKVGGTRRSRDREDGKVSLQTSWEEQGSREASNRDFSPGGKAGLEEGQYRRLQTVREEQGSWEVRIGGFRLVGRSRAPKRLAGRHRRPKGRNRASGRPAEGCCRPKGRGRSRS